jgi:hypothetical protein
MHNIFLLDDMNYELIPAANHNSMPFIKSIKSKNADLLHLANVVLYAI